MSRHRYLWALVLSIAARSAAAQTMTLDRGGATVVVEPYAPNVVRVSISLLKPWAVGRPGYGIVASPQGAGWTRDATSAGDRLRSNRLVVTVAPSSGPPAATGTAADIAKFFNGSTPAVGVGITTPQGATLLDLQDWQMSVPNHKDGN